MKKLYKNKFDKNRRDFIKTIGAAGISNGLLRASPLVGGMMLSRAAEAQTGPNKSIVSFVPGGSIYKFWEPRADFSLPSATAAYEDIKNDCLFMRNMTRAEGGGHGSLNRMLNSRWGGDSFDVNMGKVLGAGTPFSYINVGTMANGFGMMTRENGSEIPFDDNPFTVFRRLFGNGGGSSSGGNTNLTFNVIDAHKDALSALKTKLGFHEKDRLDKHLTAIEETQQRLVDLGGGNGGGSCNAGPTPAEFVLDSTTFTRQAKLQADIVTLALSCNLTRSASIAFGNHQGDYSIPELNFKGVYHNSIHGGQGGRDYIHYQEMRAHKGSLSAYLIRRLKQEGLLDSTIYLELSDMGHADMHSKTNIPMIIAGGGSATRKGNVRAGGPSYHNWHACETVAAIFGAQQHPAYQPIGNSIIPGVIA